MLTLLRWTPPEVPEHFPPEIRQYLSDQNRSIAEYLRSLENPDSLTINEASIAATNGIIFPSGTMADYVDDVWTPVDSSGASLSFSGVSGRYLQTGGWIFASGTVTYPATASGASAVIGGLPVALANDQGARGFGVISYTTEATAARIIATANATTAQIVSAAGGNISNATMSGDVIYFAFAYPVA